MHYFTHGAAIAAVEDAGQAAKYAQAGWRKVERHVFIAAWRARDMRTLAELAEAEALVEREIAAPLPRGWARYSV